MNKRLLTINGGSSSVKFAQFSAETLERLSSGKIERIQNNYILKIEDKKGERSESIPIEKESLYSYLMSKMDLTDVIAIGHRLVHGTDLPSPQKITGNLLRKLNSFLDYDPNHMPSELQLVELFRQQAPNVLQAAFFDTSFHRTMPQVAKLIPIPLKYFHEGVQRYGFHGLSYQYLLQELERLAGREVAQGKVLMAHLGNGASLCAARYGKSIDTSMGFTPASGIPMSTRTGDIDPSVAWYLVNQKRFGPRELNHLINYESGLLGLSESSSDMRELLKHQEDQRASDAVAHFCYQVKKWIGAFSTVLEGIDTLIFSGGIGENASPVREAICRGLNFLGIEIDSEKNAANASIISREGAQVVVRVMPTDEELIIAQGLKKLIS